jgi:hypothetical protein
VSAPTLVLFAGLIFMAVGVLGSLDKVKTLGQAVTGVGFLIFLCLNIAHGTVGMIAVDAMGLLACGYGLARQAVRR